MEYSLSYGGVEVQIAYEALLKEGVRSSVAKGIIGSWIGEVASGSRSFDYSKTLTTSDPSCNPSPFARSFTHQDWIDGTSVVQAGETPTEKGFNSRFHQIEADLDKLGQLVAQAFSCMNTMRQTVAASLQEIANELNRINDDIAKLDQAAPATKVPQGSIKNDWVFVGKTNYFDNSVLVFRDTDGRYINLPDFTIADIEKTSFDPRAPKAAEILGRDIDIVAGLDERFTRDQLVARYGDRTSSDGIPLRNLLSSLPSSEVYTSVDDMVTKLAELDAKVMTGLGATDNIRRSLGIDEQTAPANAQAARLAGVSTELGDALSSAGIKTVGELAALPTSKLMDIASTAGVTLSTSTAGSIIARGKTFSGIGR